MEGDKTNRRFSIEWHWGYTTFSDTHKYDVDVYHGTIRDTLDDLGAMPRVTWCRGNIQQKWWNPSDTSFIQFPFFVQIDLQKDINRVHLKFKFLVLIGFWISIGIAWTCLNHRKSCLDVHTISSPWIEALWNGTTRFLWDGGVRVPTLQSRGIIFLVMSSTRDSLNFRGSSFCTAHFWRIFVLNVHGARPHTDNKRHPIWGVHISQSATSSLADADFYIGDEANSWIGLFWLPLTGNQQRWSFSGISMEFMIQECSGWSTPNALV